MNRAIVVGTGAGGATVAKELQGAYDVTVLEAGGPFTPFGRVVSDMKQVDAINAEYGEGPGGIRAGKQDPFFGGGNTWLLREFPRLDFIRRATIIER